MNRIPGVWGHVGALFVLLVIVAAVAPDPWYGTDREHYQELGRDVVQQDCETLHCRRALFAAALERLPGPSIPKWKAAAVLSNTWAAAAVASLAGALGLTPRAAIIALWLSGVGFGGLFTLFDPYSADPLMFALGPALMTWLVRGQIARAGVLSAVGVLAKEFAAAPLWIWAGAAVLGRRWVDAARAGTVALAVTTLWLVVQVALAVALNYNYGGNPSADFLGGGYIAFWFRELGLKVGFESLLTEYGALYILAPLGFMLAGRQLRQLCLVALPVLAVFGYVQQPDRALWNFHFLVTPLAALVLERVSLVVVVALLTSFALANMRLAAQLQFLPPARYALALSMLIALTAVIAVWRPRLKGTPARLHQSGPSPRGLWKSRWRSGPSSAATMRARASARAVDLSAPTFAEATPQPGFSASFRLLLAVSATVALAAAVLLVDMEVHRAVQRERGLNRQGYRGEVMRAKATGEMRVALLGGATAFSPDMNWDQSLGFVLARFLGQRWRWQQGQMVTVTVADLSQPNDTAESGVRTLRAFQYLKPDIICLMTGHNDLPGVSLTAGGRWDSATYAATGYLPALPAFLTGSAMTPPAPELRVDAHWLQSHQNGGGTEDPTGACASGFQKYCTAVKQTIDHSLAQGQQVLVVAEPFISAEHFAQQRALAAMLSHRYGSERRVRYLDLGWRVNLLDATLAKGAALTARGIEEYADDLFTAVFKMVTQS
jgi:hypothetical protein